MSTKAGELQRTVRAASRAADAQRAAHPKTDASANRSRPQADHDWKGPSRL